MSRTPTRQLYAIRTSATLLLGKMSDIWGKKRIFLLCGIFFVVGCLIDSVTDDWTWFLIGRSLQAFAIASQMIAYGLIRDLLPRRLVPVGLGITAAGLGFSSVLAPVLGGYMVDHFDWRAIFWFLGGFVAVMTPIVMLVVPETRVRVRDRIDPVGAVLLASGTALVLLYLDKGQDWGWGDPTSWAWLVVGLLLLATFVIVETRIARPLMDIKLMLSPRGGLVLLMTLFGSAMLGVQGYATGYMSQAPGETEMKALVTQGVVDQAKERAGVNLPATAVQLELDPGYRSGRHRSVARRARHPLAHDRRYRSGAGGPSDRPHRPGDPVRYRSRVCHLQRHRAR